MASIDGLVTGLDTTTIINQLIQLEAAPQSRLKSKVSEYQTMQGAYQSINARMLAVGNAAQHLTKDATWQAVRATSSSDTVTAAGTTAAVSGSVTFDVVRMAATHSVTSEVPATGPLTTGSGLSLTIGGRTVAVPVTTDTAQGVAAAVNASDAGVRATVLTTTTGDVLQFTAARSGVAQAFTVTGLANPVTVRTTGADAEVATGGYRITSQDNTFTGLLSGVSIRIRQVESGVTVSAAPDVNALADAVQSLVSAVNAATTDIAGRSGYNPTTKTSGVLNGNTLARGLRQELLGAVSGGVAESVGGHRTLKAVGVELDRSGILTFDRTAFTAAYQADPGAVRRTVAAGMATTYDGIADSATDNTSGRLTLVIQGGSSALRTLDREIADWDVRLAARRETLQRRYADLETALGQLKNQSSWLAGQLASLPTASS
jgi:flagellar hook-associated protein 2